MAAVLTWNDDRAVLSDGTAYVLASEDFNGAHGGRMWEVFVYEEVGQSVTRILKVRGAEWPTKRRARALAEADAKAKLIA